jgi:hypothetical protein
MMGRRPMRSDAAPNSTNSGVPISKAKVKTWISWQMASAALGCRNERASCHWQILFQTARRFV